MPGSLGQQVVGLLLQAVARTVVGTPAVGEVDRTDYSVLVVALVVKLATDRMNSPKYFADLAETRGPVKQNIDMNVLVVLWSTLSFIMFSLLTCTSYVLPVLCMGILF